MRTSRITRFAMWALVMTLLAVSFMATRMDHAEAVLGCPPYEFELDEGVESATNTVLDIEGLTYERTVFDSSGGSSTVTFPLNRPDCLATGPLRIPDPCPPNTCYPTFQWSAEIDTALREHSDKTAQRCDSFHDILSGVAPLPQAWSLPALEEHVAIWCEKTMKTSQSPDGGSGGADNDYSSRGPAVSPLGRLIAFTTSTDLTPLDGNFGADDVYVRDMADGTVELISYGGFLGGGGANPAMSADGRYVVFESLQSFGDDTNGSWDVYLRDRQLPATTRVSVTPTGGQVNGSSKEATIDATGQRLAFSTDAPLMATDLNSSNWDVYVRDLQDGTFTHASAGILTSEHWRDPALSADGASVVFGSPNNGIFKRNLVNQSLTRIDVGLLGAVPDGPARGYAVSADGRFVAFVSQASNLVPTDLNGKADVFLRDTVTGTTRLVSVTAAGAQANDHCSVPAAADPMPPSISADGRYIAFACRATNLVVPDANPLRDDIFVWDRDSGAITLQSVSSADVQGIGFNYSPTLSPEGMYVVFLSDASNLTLGDVVGTWDIFRRQLF